MRKVPSILSCLTILMSLSLTHCGGEEPELNDTDDGVIDNDQDGVAASADCDDEDPNSTVVADDGDCDGTLTADDCDDEDATSTVVADDGDCDGTLTADDCDDGDATLNKADADGDGQSTCAGDCDDAEPLVNTEAPEVWPNGVDDDCDGLVDFNIQPGDWQFINTKWVAGGTCGVWHLLNDPGDRGGKITAIPDGFILEEDGLGKTDCIFDGSQFNCKEISSTFDLNVSADLDAKISISTILTVEEKSPTSIAVGYDMTGADDCKGDDCPVVSLLVILPCSILSEGEGEKE